MLQPSSSKSIIEKIEPVEIDLNDKKEENILKEFNIDGNGEIEDEDDGCG